jgi:hypothetical protein
MDWFTANKDGLRQIAERHVEQRGFGIICGELYQNSMDTAATKMHMSIKKVAGRPIANLEVTDNNPTGFSNLSDAWTMFAPSEKKGDPSKAGRFNLGEKMVLSFCNWAAIATTSGTVEFSEAGRKLFPRRKRGCGTLFCAEIKCTQEWYDQFIEYARKLIVRTGLEFTINDQLIAPRFPIKMFEEALQTEIGDTLRKTIRTCKVEIHEVRPGETAMLYELGIPVVETEDRWHYNVMQKVPLNVERDNVTPAYLRSLRTAVFNHMHSMITPEDTTKPWVNEAASDSKCEAEAIETFRVNKYGKKSVAFDPSNSEANAEAVAAGYTVIPSRGLTAGQRDNLYKHNLLNTSSEAFPTAGKGAYSDDPNALPVVLLSDSELTDDMKLIREYTIGVAQRLLNKRIDVQFVRVKNFAHKAWRACYGRGHLLGISSFHYNLGKLSKEWFANGATLEVDSLILHELGHEFESNHLCDEYYRALTNLGAKLKAAALKEPGWFLRYVK